MKIKIAGMPYKVKQVDVIDEESEGITRGLILYTEGKILIKRKAKNKAETLMHEIIHGVLVEIGRNDLTEDETFVQSMANALMNTELDKVKKI